MSSSRRRIERPIFPGSVPTMRLDFNEGARPDRELLGTLQDPEQMRIYPDRSRLEMALADRFGIEQTRILVTAGADDALDRVCRLVLAPGRRLMQLTPGFATLGRLAEQAAGASLDVPWGPGEPFPTDAVLAGLDAGVGAVAIISPSNPTGAVISRVELEMVAAAAATADVLVILDQVYGEYAEGTEGLTETALGLENVLLVRTFSKAWGLAGCRVGYLVGNQELLSRLRGVGNPYPVAGPSLLLAEKRLLDGEAELRAHVSEVKRERDQLRTWLQAQGIAVSESHASFLLVELGTKAGFVARALGLQGIRVRCFARPGLEGCLRITLPGEVGEFDRLIAGLSLCLLPEALVFDLDGVLADVRESYDRAIVKTAERFGVEVGRAEIVRERELGEANSDWDLTKKLLASAGVEVSRETIRDVFQDLYLGNGEGLGLRELETPLVEKAFLERLALRWPLAIVTGRPRDEAEYFLESIACRHLFDVLVAMEDAPAKPDPAPVRLALDRLGIQRAFFLGDTPDDMRAGIAAAVLPIGVVAPGGVSAKVLSEYGALETLNSIMSLEDVLP